MYFQDKSIKLLNDEVFKLNLITFVILYLEYLIKNQQQLSIFSACIYLKLGKYFSLKKLN